MAAKPIKFLELHYTMTQFLIIYYIPVYGWNRGNLSHVDYFVKQVATIIIIIIIITSTSTTTTTTTIAIAIIIIVIILIIVVVIIIINIIIIIIVFVIIIVIIALFLGTQVRWLRSPAS